MKTLLTTTFALLTIFCSGQNEALFELTIPYRPATIKILTDTALLDIFNINSNIIETTYKNIKAGRYKIQISGQGQSTIDVDSIIVKEGQTLRLAFIFNGPCLYDHLPGYIPICPKNHQDSIIPIVYGLVATKVNKFTKKVEVKDENIRLGGCVVTGCDPKFYCKKHDMEF